MVVENEGIAPTPLPPGISRRELLKRCARWSILPAIGGIYATQIEPFWLDVHEFSLTIPRLPRAFDGVRIAHLSDLHAGDHVPFEYLRGAIERVERLKVDYVLLSGDVVHHAPAWIDRISELLGSLSMPVFVSFGNHDYGVDRGDGMSCPELADRLEAGLQRAGCTVLRNSATMLRRGAERLWIVGVDDLWFGKYLPDVAFAGVNRGDAVIVMSHNPDTVPDVYHYNPSLILCGHTHGGQVRLPGLGAIRLNVGRRDLDQGYRRMGESQLYISRGVGYLKRIRFLCRPELPVIQLKALHL